MSETTTGLPAILPTEGLHVVHLFYKLEQEPWQYLEATERAKRREHLERVVAQIRSQPDTQLLPYSVVSPKADLGFMLLTPDLQVADRSSKMLGEALGAGILTPVFSWLSMTERSEYMTSETEYSAELRAEGIDPSMPEFSADRKSVV